PRPLRLVSATRRSRRDFWSSTLLGQSLMQFPEALRPELAIRFDNTGPDTEGLPAIYNAAIDACPTETNLLFVHDDVYLHDLFLCHHVSEGLVSVDVLGLAGSSGSALDQPSWGLAFNSDLDAIGWQPGVRLSGAVSHTGPGPVRASPPIQLSEHG